jgi:phosphohistidine phosphatase
MSRELLLLRNGKSYRTTGLEDYQRPLKDRGKRGAQRMAVWLQQQGLVPDHVVASPAERALVTAEKTCKAMGIGSKMIQKEKRVYAARLDDLLETLKDCPKKAKRVMLVGHNPGLEELLLYLAGSSEKLPEESKLLPTATLVRLTMPANWKKLGCDCARLESITQSGNLPKKFPFPTPDSGELRDRPAYYYTQSSIIPYRIKKGKPEILIISSSKMKHWVVPKGIKEPGLSQKQSAAKEAWEEAGVKGKTGRKSIGAYSYEKWGASCSVRVYPMKVNKVISDRKWQERHRGREWVTPEQAAARLKQAELGPMVLSLAERLNKQ